MTRNQSKAYAAITLDLLYKMKVKISPEILAKQMNLIFDLYNLNEIEVEYEKMIKNNKTINKKSKGNVSSYIINIFDSCKEQIKLIENFCKRNNLTLGKIYITNTRENSEKYYEIIRDIRNKEFNVLVVTIFTMLGLTTKEWSVLVKICRENKVAIIEV